MKLPFVRAPRRSGKHEPRTSSQATAASSADHHSGVALAPGSSGSRVLLEALAEAVRRHPGALGAVRLPSDSAAFKRSFAEVLVRFEAHRAASPERVAIARTLIDALHQRLFFRAGTSNEPLSEHLMRAHAAVPARAIGGRREKQRWSAEIPWRHDVFRGAARIGEMVDRMRQENLLTEDARTALAWMVARLGAGGVLDLDGERFAILGAGAELAPTEMLLQAGAEVLWIDRAPPPERLLSGDFAGRLHVIEGASGIDLLREPARARQAIIDFAAACAGPVHLGLYAYAPGKGRELRLAAVMDAIARSLPAGVAKSVSLLVSPTTPGEVQPEDRAAAGVRHASAQVWKKTLERTGLLPTGAHETVGAVTVSRTIVSLQGTAYQAAQYLAKMMSAEALLADGIGGAGVTVSANVAGITATRSLLHPLFQAAFLGSPRFHIEIYEPATTRLLSGLLVLHDLLCPGAPGAASVTEDDHAERARRLTAQTIHGGLRALPWVMEPTIRVAALLGLGKKPSLMAGLIPRKKR